MENLQKNLKKAIFEVMENPPGFCHPQEGRFAAPEQEMTFLRRNKARWAVLDKCSAQPSLGPT